MAGGGYAVDDHSDDAIPPFVRRIGTAVREAPSFTRYLLDQCFTVGPLLFACTFGLLMPHLPGDGGHLDFDEISFLARFQTWVQARIFAILGQ